MYKKPDKCPSCKKTDHLRSSSSKCENFKPRPSKRKPDVIIDENQYLDTSFGYAIKTGLKTILKNDTLQNAINTRVQQITLIAFQASRLLNLHLLRCLEYNVKIPILNDTYISHVFSIVQKPTNFNFSKFDANLIDTYVNYYQFDYELVTLTSNSTQMMRLFTKSYLVNLNNHIYKLYWSNLRKFCNHYFFNDDTLVDSCIEFFEENPSLELIMNTYGRNFTMFQQDNLILSNYESTKKLDEIKRSRLVIRRFVMRIIMNSDVSDTKIMKRIEEVWIRYKKLSQNSEQQLKSNTIVPLCTSVTKYITIDTDVLHGLLGGQKVTGYNKTEFGKDFQHEMWKKTFKLKEKWLQLDTEQKIFAFQILTDGVGCSIIFKKFIKRNKSSNKSSNKNEDEFETETEFDKRTKKRKLEKKKKKEYITAKKKEIKVEEPILVPSDKRVYVGIDPGTGSILTSVTQYQTSTGIIEIEKSVSNGEYHHLCHHKHRSMDMEKKLVGIKEWMSSTPTPKTMVFNEFRNYLRHVYTKEYNLKLQEYHFRWKTRLKRWNEYIQQQKTIHKICLEIMETVPENRECVVAFGDASWSQRKGYTSSPRGKKFYDYFKRKFESNRVKIFSTPEFNTSQVCSKCNLHERVEKVKDAEITKPHFVRKCRTCLTIWNRDINACRNIITVAKGILEDGKKPEIFSKQIPKSSLGTIRRVSNLRTPVL